MANAKHGVVGTPDPDFKPDPKKHLVYDQKKGVYRLVPKDKPKRKT